MQRIPGHGALRSPCLDELASSHGSGSRSSSVPDSHAPALKKKTPALTLPMTFRLLCAVLPQPKLTVDDALGFMEYHIDRNRIAQRSHTKTWWRRHPKAKPKALL